jgi:hypothetical protein
MDYGRFLAVIWKDAKKAFYFPQFTTHHFGVSQNSPVQGVDELVKSRQRMVSIVGARRVAPDIGHAQRAPTMQGAQKIIIVRAIHESPLQARRSDSPC